LEENINDVKKSFNDVSGEIKSIFSKKDNKSNKIEDHIISDLDELNKTILNLEKNISLGVPLTEAGDNLNRLNNLIREMKSFESKISIYATKAAELDQKSKELEKFASEKISEKQFKTLFDKVVSLEQVYSNSTISKTNDSIKSLLDIINKLENRVKSLEEKIKNEVDLSQTIIHKVDEQKMKKSVEEKPKGFFEKLKDLFKS
jgi:chromosome segregation ATPase